MTDRIRLDDLTSDQLDQLYNQIDALRTVATSLHRTLGGYLGDQDARAIARLRELHREDYGSCAECTHEYGVPYPCPTIRTLDHQEQPRV